MSRRTKRRMYKRSQRRVYYVMLGGKRIKTNARGYRAHQAVVRTLKGVELLPD